MYSIAKSFHFSASHQLTHLPEGHKCHRLHGHNYRLKVELCSDYLDDRGFVCDYGDLDFIKIFIRDQVDHRHLNEVFGGSRETTAESLAEWFNDYVMANLKERVSSDQLPEVITHISETSNTWASFSREDSYIGGST